MGLPTVGVGNDFLLPQPRVIAAPVNTPTVVFPEAPALSVEPRQFVPAYGQVNQPVSLPWRLLDTAHRYSLGVFAILFLILGSVTTLVGASYWSAHLESQVDHRVVTAIAVAPIAGLNLMIPSSSLSTKLQAVTTQTANLDIGQQTIAISPATIRSWLQVTPSRVQATDYIHVKAAAISGYLTQLTSTYVKAPINQVTATHNDATPSGIIEAGSNGTKLSNSANLSGQAQQIAKNLLGAAGFQVNAPLQTVPFQAVTPAAFGKLLEVDVTTKRMYAYDNGQLVQTFLVSAGKPSTPTPLGEFHIWDKLPSQTMVGPGYVQPNVPWVNYFDHSGDAVHGVYWRPASVFGNINTSHGCVGVPVDQAKWIYDWAPIGTTVIIHA